METLSAIFTILNNIISLYILVIFLKLLSKLELKIDQVINPENNQSPFKSSAKIFKNKTIAEIEKEKSNLPKAAFDPMSFFKSLRKQNDR